MSDGEIGMLRQEVDRLRRVVDTRLREDRRGVDEMRTKYEVLLQLIGEARGLRADGSFLATVTALADRAAALDRAVVDSAEIDRRVNEEITRVIQARVQAVAEEMAAKDPDVRAKLRSHIMSALSNQIASVHVHTQIPEQLKNELISSAMAEVQAQRTRMASVDPTKRSSHTYWSEALLDGLVKNAMSTIKTRMENDPVGFFGAEPHAYKGVSPWPVVVVSDVFRAHLQAAIARRLDTAEVKAALSYIVDKELVRLGIDPRGVAQRELWYHLMHNHKSGGTGRMAALAAAVTDGPTWRRLSAALRAARAETRRGKRDLAGRGVEEE